jgi:hypothetical protein
VKMTHCATASTATVDLPLQSSHASVFLNPFTGKGKRKVDTHDKNIGKSCCFLLSAHRQSTIDCRYLKMIARQKDTGFGWKFEEFEFRAAFTIVQHFHFFEK